MKKSWMGMMVVGFVFACAGAVRAGDQVWWDAGGNNIWSTNDLNWDVGVAWTNGNSAVFSGSGGLGETIDVSNDVRVANFTFQTNGYVIADADNNGTLTIMGAPSVITTSLSGSTGTISEVVSGSGGFTKAGAGVLNLTATPNTFTGVLRVSSGVLRLATGALYALGAGGVGNETIVENGATLNFNGAYTTGVTTENISISGSGVDGLGVLVNTGATFMNSGFGTVTLLANSTIGGPTRIDLRNTLYGNGYTLTKAGSCELAVAAIVTNCPVVINAGIYTYMNSMALGGNDYDTMLNGGKLRTYGTYTITERLIGNNGTIVSAGPVGASLNFSGLMTLNSNVVLDAESSTSLDVSGLLVGAGGITRSGNNGGVYITGNSNTFSGATIVNNTLYIGRTNLYSGALGSGPVTNNSTLYCYSGKLGTGDIVNNYRLFFDGTNAFTCSNAFLGTGLTAIRYGGAMTISGNVSSNAFFYVANGSLTLTNGADFCVYSEFDMADRANVFYPVDPSNVTASVNILTGTTFRAAAIIIGNGNSGSMTGTINQVGGLVRTTGVAAEGNGMRLGHYPTAYGVYNMMGGKLVVEKDVDLCIATDGRGWLNMTGGEVFTKRVMLNERDNGLGYGRLTVAGGVLNVGSLTGSAVALSNGIATDVGAPYLVEYGGSGGIIRAVTNVYSSLAATLFGTNDNAITFDTTNFTINLSGNLTGSGGLNKTGSGTLILTGANVYSGGTSIKEGTLTVNARSSVPNGALNFGVSANGACGVLNATGDLSLTGLSVGIVNPSQLAKLQSYTIITYAGALSGTLSTDSLPSPWYVYYDSANHAVKLRATVGTMIRFY
jgi:autotransporter-associated beta strand protein